MEASGELKTVAISLHKIANDIRFIASGPRAGLGEINLPEVQPGSSIMPGKVNPVIAESVVQVVAQVVGNDAAVTLAGQGGYFELNTMMPVAAHNILESISLLAASANNFADQCVEGIEATSVGPEMVERGLMLGTALAPAIGYDAAAAIAKEAAARGSTIREIAKERTELSEAEADSAETAEGTVTNRGGRWLVAAANTNHCQISENYAKRGLPDRSPVNSASALAKSETGDSELFAGWSASLPEGEVLGDSGVEAVGATLIGGVADCGVQVLSSQAAEEVGHDLLDAHLQQIVYFSGLMLKRPPPGRLAGCHLVEGRLEVVLPPVAGQLNQPPACGRFGVPFGLQAALPDVFTYFPLRHVQAAGCFLD